MSTRFPAGFSVPLFATFLFGVFLCSFAWAFSPKHGLQRAKVVDSVTESVAENEFSAGGVWQALEIETGGETHTLQYGSDFQPLQASQVLKPGQSILVASTSKESSDLSVVDVYRLTGVAILFSIFTLLVVALTGAQGLRALLGMALTFASLLGGLLPWLLQGGDPVLGASIWAMVVATGTIYLSHGVNRTSHVALLSILGVLTLVGLLSLAAVQSLHLTGLGSEEAMFLQVGALALPLQGIFLAGILLGVLGILDDICLAQVALVEELFFAKSGMQMQELWERALRVGRTHVVSLVNTLILAYASANLPLFILFLLNEGNQPWWAILNSELIVEEIVRTLAGSIGLILAVPISTLFAAFALLHLPQIMSDTPQASKKKTLHSHHHQH